MANFSIFDKMNHHAKHGNTNLPDSSSCVINNKTAVIIKKSTDVSNSIELGLNEEQQQEEEVDKLVSFIDAGRLYGKHESGKRYFFGLVTTLGMFIIGGVLSSLVISLIVGLIVQTNLNKVVATVDHTNGNTVITFIR